MRAPAPSADTLVQGPPSACEAVEEGEVVIDGDLLLEDVEIEERPASEARAEDDSSGAEARPKTGAASGKQGVVSGDEEVLDEPDATTAPPAAVSAPMALDWEDEEEHTLVYEREESPYQAEAKVVIDEGLAVCDEAPTRRHERSEPPPRSGLGQLDLSTGVALRHAPVSLGARASEAVLPSAGAPSAAARHRRADGPSGAPLPFPKSPEPKRVDARPQASLPPIVPLPPQPPVPAALPLPSPSAVRALPPPPEADFPRALPFGRRNEPTLVQPVARREGAGPLGQRVPSSVPPPFVGEPRDSQRAAGGQRSRVWLALGAAAAVAAAAVVAGLMLVPREGHLEVVVRDADGNQVPAAEVFLDGKKQCDAAPCVMRDLPAGSAIVRAVAPGFVGSGAVTAEVEAGDDKRIVIEMLPATATVRATGSQAGVRVRVDGEDRGALPLDLSDLEPGEHEIVFEGGDRYERSTRTIDVDAGDALDLGEVKLAVLKGEVEISLETEGAAVTVERVSSGAKSVVKAVSGPFPVKLELDGTESWRVVAKKRGLPDFVHDVDFSDGEANKRVSVELSEPSEEPEPSDAVASLSLATPSAGSPVVSSAVTPSPKAEPPAPAAPPPPDEDTKAAKTGRLNVNSIPVSRVMVDGATLGETPRVDIELSPGIHTVTFVHPELGRKSVTVNIKPGQTSTAAVKLRD